MRMMRRQILVLFVILASLGSLVGCSSVSRRLVEWKKGEYRQQARLVEKRLEVAGHQIVYLDRGGGGEPMVLVHGFGGDKDNWTLLAQAIPDSYRVIALDLPGFGESSREPAQRYDVRAQSERVRAFLDALGLQRVHLAGNSMGGNIAARFALDHPERLRSLALLASSGVRAPHPSAVTRAIDAGHNPLVVSTPDDFERIMALTFVKPPPLPGFIKSYFAERAFINRAFNQRIFADMLARPDPLEGELARLRVPTLILWGDHDLILDASAAAVFAAGIRGARRVILKQCGHAPMIERPRETAADYLDFLGGLAR